MELIPTSMENADLIISVQFRSRKMHSLLHPMSLHWERQARRSRSLQMMQR